MGLFRHNFLAVGAHWVAAISPVGASDKRAFVPANTAWQWPGICTFSGRIR